MADKYIILVNYISIHLKDIKRSSTGSVCQAMGARSFLREDENFRGFLFIVTRNLIFNRQKKHLMKTSINCLF